MARNRRPVMIIIRTVILLLPVAVVLYWLCCISRPGSKVKTCSLKEPDELRVASINIGRFSLMRSAEMNAAFLLDALIRNQVDVLVVQEYTEKSDFKFADLKQAFSLDYPYISAKGEQAIISKFPFDVQRNEDFNMEHGSFASYMLRLPAGDSLRMISVHLHTTGISALERTGNYDLTQASSVMSSNRKLRKYQALAVKEQVESSTSPLIVAGDFNSIPYSKVYRIIRSSRLQDCYQRCGRGNGSTFRELYNLLRIDYILPSDDFLIREFVVCDDYLSDHRMVISTLKKR